MFSCGEMQHTKYIFQIKTEQFYIWITFLRHYVRVLQNYFMQECVYIVQDVVYVAAI